MSELSADALRNRAAWTQENDHDTDGNARVRWVETAMSWGVYGVLEDSLQSLGEVRGRDIVELGCGSASVSAWLTRRGAVPTSAPGPAPDRPSAARPWPSPCASTRGPE